mmetsp:Transcript_22254/g.75558  ORF Transcript_22254/g.75558 Transcript_22254/m.75558 type:complete len:421 (-) Transcript_22254:545-1807(-)
MGAHRVAAEAHLHVAAVLPPAKASRLGRLAAEGARDADVVDLAVAEPEQLQEAGLQNADGEVQQVELAHGGGPGLGRDLDGERDGRCRLGLHHRHDNVLHHGLGRELEAQRREVLRALHGRRHGRGWDGGEVALDMVLEGCGLQRAHHNKPPLGGVGEELVEPRARGVRVRPQELPDGELVVIVAPAVVDLLDAPRVHRAGVAVLVPDRLRRVAEDGPDVLGVLHALPHGEEQVHQLEEGLQVPRAVVALHRPAVRGDPLAELHPLAREHLVYHLGLHAVLPDLRDEHVGARRGLEVFRTQLGEAALRGPGPQALVVEEVGALVRHPGAVGQHELRRVQRGEVPPGHDRAAGRHGALVLDERLGDVVLDPRADVPPGLRLAYRLRERPELLLGHHPAAAARLDHAAALQRELVRHAPHLL